MQTYVMERRGSFQTLEPTSNQCKAPHHIYYDYVCRVAFSPRTKLNEQKFILDHVKIDEAIQGCNLIGSCEEMHQNMMKSVRTQFTQLGIPALAIKLVIKPKWPEGVADLTYLYCKHKDHLTYLTV